MQSQRARALELGCGAGNVTIFMASIGLEAYGIDSSAEAIAWARERQEGSSLVAEFRQGDVVDLADFSSGWFDLVFDGDCLHQICGADRRKCMQSVYRVLRPGGVFYAAAILFNEAMRDTISVAQDIVFDPRKRCLLYKGKPYNFLSRQEEFLEELRQAGFVVAKYEQRSRRPNAELFEAGYLLVDALKPAVDCTTTVKLRQ